MRDPFQPTTAAEVQRDIRRVRIGGADVSRRDYTNMEVSFVPPEPGNDGFDFSAEPEKPWESMVMPDHGSPRVRPTREAIESKVADAILAGKTALPKDGHFREDGTLVIDLAPKKRRSEDIVAHLADEDVLG